MVLSETKSVSDISSVLTQYPLIVLSLGTLGGLSLASFLFTAVRVLLQTFVLRGISLKKYGAKKGVWAVVTGATDGIGREFANQLAKAGFNVLLVSRNPDKLSAVGSEIEAKYGNQTKMHTIDFSAPDEKAYDGLASLISGLEIGVLVNNVGRSHDFPVYFQDTTQEVIQDIIEINVKATLRVTSIILPSLIARKNGLILNIGSFAAAVPSPMLATYAGAKAFLATWSQALGEELRSTGVLVQHVNTFWVVSAMSKIRKPSALTPLPSTYVRAVLSHIGLPCGALGSPYYTTPYWAHSIVDFVLRQVGLMGIYMRVTHGMHKDLRARALKKLAREAKSQ